MTHLGHPVRHHRHTSRCGAACNRATGWGRLAWLALVLAMFVAPGCAKAKEDRARSEAVAKAAAAIERYSQASDSANNAHRAVMKAFADANRSTNLSDYKSSLRNEVLPRMREFIGLLEAMPTDTAELKGIHGKLIEGYRRARDDIADFERGLEDPSGLAKFDVIRADLQQAVRAYKTALDSYYAMHKRQLRMDGGAEAAASSAEATPTAAAAQAAPASSAAASAPAAVTAPSAP